MPVETIKNALKPSEEPDLKFVAQQAVGSLLRIAVPAVLLKLGVDRVEHAGSIDVLVGALAALIVSLLFSVRGRLKLLVTVPKDAEGAVEQAAREAVAVAMAQMLKEKSTGGARADAGNGDREAGAVVVPEQVVQLAQSVGNEVAP